jgi:hypothetical protein
MNAGTMQPALFGDKIDVMFRGRNPFKRAEQAKKPRPTNRLRPESPSHVQEDLETIIHTLFPPTSSLTGLGSNLDRRTLSTLLAGDATTSLALGGRGGELGLLSLLGSSGGLLLVLALLDGGEAGGGTGLGAHRATLLDHIEGSTNDSTLGLDGAAGALLGDFL